MLRRCTSTLRNVSLGAWVILLLPGLLCSLYMFFLWQQASLITPPTPQNNQNSTPLELVLRCHVQNLQAQANLGQLPRDWMGAGTMRVPVGLLHRLGSSKVLTARASCTTSLTFSGKYDTWGQQTSTMALRVFISHVHEAVPISYSSRKEPRLGFLRLVSIKKILGVKSISSQ
jgi:hypothetical protein